MPVLKDIVENEVIALDQVDRDILAILQNDGRSSASYVAQEISMSVPAVTDRILAPNAVNHGRGGNRVWSSVDRSRALPGTCGPGGGCREAARSSLAAQTPGSEIAQG